MSNKEIIEEMPYLYKDFKRIGYVEWEDAHGRIGDGLPKEYEPALVRNYGEIYEFKHEGKEYILVIGVKDLTLKSRNNIDTFPKALLRKLHILSFPHEWNDIVQGKIQQLQSTDEFRPSP